MDTDLVESAQHGDKGAFTSLAAAVADRFLATSHRILRDIEPCRGRDAAGTADHLAGPSAAPRPGALRRLVVPDPRACLLRRGQRMRRWTPNIHLLPADEPAAADGSSAVVDRDQLERGFRRLSLDHRTVVVLHHYLDLPLDQVADVARHPGRDGRFSTSSRDARAARGARRRCAPDFAEGRAMSHRSRRRPASFDPGCTRTRIENADRVLDLVLDQLDTTPQRRARWLARRFRP